MRIYEQCYDACSKALPGRLCNIGCSGILLAPFSDDLLEDCDKSSPLILDLDGDGVEADAITYFDHKGDGWTELSRWADEDDGTLVWDRNNDGIINDGSEFIRQQHGFSKR